jgi:hypothetical protein
MGKRFITARDIDELAAGGACEVQIDNDTVLTDVGRERARERGLLVVRAESLPKPVSPEGPAVPESKTLLAAAVKKAVIAHLGTAPAGLDQIISDVISGR